MATIVVPGGPLVPVPKCLDCGGSNWIQGECFDCFRRTRDLIPMKDRILTIELQIKALLNAYPNMWG